MTEQKTKRYLKCACFVFVILPDTDSGVPSSLRVGPSAGGTQNSAVGVQLLEGRTCVPQQGRWLPLLVDSVQHVRMRKVYYLRAKNVIKGIGQKYQPV